MNHTVKSLIFVVEHSVRAVETFASKLEGLTPGDQRIPSLLKSLVTESDVLSSALVAASRHVEVLPEDEAVKRRHDPELAKQQLSQAQRFFAAAFNGICETCGGAKRSEIAPNG